MNRPTRKQLLRTITQTAALATIEAGSDHLETAAADAGLPFLAIALHITTATIAAVVAIALDTVTAPRTNDHDAEHTDTERERPAEHADTEQQQPQTGNDQDEEGQNEDRNEPEQPHDDDPDT